MGAASNAIIVPIVKSSKPVATGRKIFHPISISWSYRYLGTVARRTTKYTQKMRAFKERINDAGRKAGPDQPPKKSSA